MSKMKKLEADSVRPLLFAAALTAAGVAMAPPLMAQSASTDGDDVADSETAPGGAAIEEVISVGRALSSTQEVLNERMEDASVTDALSADSISRLGDSTVASALRRIPGLSLVGNKFVYIRGLGERYSSSTLNGATIPSPDLTRNVIPLDIFPTSVLESLQVQKAWAPDISANFGGGAVDIRTTSVPDAFSFGVELSSGFNSQSTGELLGYNGGSDDSLGVDDGTRALSPTIVDALIRYQGNLDPDSIFRFEEAQDSSFTQAQADQINRELATALYRDIDVQSEGSKPDLGVKANVGNSFLIGDAWTAGFAFGGSYDTDVRHRVRRARNFNFPDERTDTESETTRTVNLSGIANFGIGWLDDHEISTTTLFLRNTDDEAAIRDFFNENGQVSDTNGFREYRLQFEERELLTNQVRGRHTVGADTVELLPFLGYLPEGTELNWFSSDSEASTHIPNQVSVLANTQTPAGSETVLDESVARQSSAADFRFTDLVDEVQHTGVSLSLPLETDRSRIELKAGAEHARKGRSYLQTQFSLGPLSVRDPSVLQGPLDQVFSDAEILDNRNDFVFDRQGANNQSYLAATMTDSVFGLVDWTLDETWRAALGGRWESYRQVALDINPYGFSESDPVASTDPSTLASSTFGSDEFYPSVALTWMSDFWAETFQLRFGWSRTSVRPDLREITDAAYVDPVDGILTFGNSGVTPSDVSNFDLRAEWFFSTGDQLTVSLFHKDIDEPIEFFEAAASDTTVAREIVNAESATVTGIEFEGLKELSFLGGYGDAFFVQGNLTVQDSELVAGPRADAPTNPVRSLQGASDFVANVTLGFDSYDGMHTASLVYNVFGERLSVSGRNGAPDAFEQPFHSLDLTYSWYPLDALTVKLKAQNLLGSVIELQREGVTILEEDPGSTFGLGLSWDLR